MCFQTALAGCEQAPVVWEKPQFSFGKLLALLEVDMENIIISACTGTVYH